MFHSLLCVHSDYKTKEGESWREAGVLVWGQEGKRRRHKAAWAEIRRAWAFAPIALSGWRRQRCDSGRDAGRALSNRIRDACSGLELYG